MKKLCLVDNKLGNTQAECDKCEQSLQCQIANENHGKCDCEFKEKCFYQRQNLQKSIRDELGLDKTDCTFFIMYSKQKENEIEKKRTI